MKAALFKTAVSLSMIFSMVAVPAAQARSNDRADFSDPKQPKPATEKSVREYGFEEFVGSWGISPDMLINCDPQGDLLSKVSPANVQSSHRLQGGICPQQTTSAESGFSDGSKTESACKGCGGSPANKNNSGLSGEHNMIKIQPVVTEVQYVYLQCGKKVGVFGPPTCTCGSNWNYTYSCKKPKTVYITIPCH